MSMIYCAIWVVLPVSFPGQGRGPSAPQMRPYVYAARDGVARPNGEESATYNAFKRRYGDRNKGPSWRPRGVMILAMARRTVVMVVRMEMNFTRALAPFDEVLAWRRKGQYEE